MTANFTNFEKTCNICKSYICLYLYERPPPIKSDELDEMAEDYSIKDLQNFKYFFKQI